MIRLMPKHRRKRRLWDMYRFPGFQPSTTVKGIFGNPNARVIVLTRRPKKRAAERAAACSRDGTIGRREVCAIFPVAIEQFTWNWKSAALPAERVAR